MSAAPNNAKCVRVPTFKSESSSAEEGVKSLLKAVKKVFDWLIVLGGVGVLYQFFRDNHTMLRKFMIGWGMLLIMYMILSSLI